MGPLKVALHYERPPQGISREDVPLVAGAMSATLPAGQVQVAPGSVDRDRTASRFDLEVA